MYTPFKVVIKILTTDSSRKNQGDLREFLAGMKK
ncbi:hypothetical protein Bd3470 [Bdellovibrio bacteriovorus HD100]|uniref:Uncharacterized protein n=1 Tax=Bdellovibrio bacteriovorus (strain ATCC 15356 / DSM 50701 / NCIMB 9529 / HD100) TaxID=264462 RepID=Q6MHS0_BDEBA|nr:hypothetical protein Bd3470 [Bdellovibrio bacteriovorus HD100]